ncbi:MAG: APC family permease [Deltaproteobacteria bacterium]|nr:APC family permease [Deltaproteobacteria bacterium]
MPQERTFWQSCKRLILGSARNPYDHSVFHKMSLIAFFAWVGLGADGLSSSAYGPEEAFLALQGHPHLGIFVALASAITIFVISASYSQIIELFPSGGGGYLVASKLLNPTLGMVSGCALLIDYVLTISISVASGADALFSFLPAAWYPFKLEFALVALLGMTLLNMRGIRESVVVWTPIFLIFVITHFFAIAYAIVTHLFDFPGVVQATVETIQRGQAEIGFLGILFLVMRAYSMGAGTFTGIEAVSNGLPILREPRVQTGKKTMNYMAVSLALTVVGLMIAYLLYSVAPEQGKTLNAVLFNRISEAWGEGIGRTFILTALVSEASILFVAAQSGFLDGPRVLSNMALDRWFPTRFTMLSDRLVTQNGILLMGTSALVTMVFTGGSVRLLVVLYSINVFITFVLSQLGMVRHWWLFRSRERVWKKKILISGVGLGLTAFILVSVTLIKFYEGGWITLLVTGGLVTLVVTIRRHYDQAGRMLKRLDSLVEAAEATTTKTDPTLARKRSSGETLDPQAKTAVFLVNGFNGLGLHTLFSVIRLFGEVFKNYLFIQVGVIDAGVFKGEAEIAQLEAKVKRETERYVAFMKRHGYNAEAVSSLGTDVVEQVAGLMPKVMERFPEAVIFGGQLVFPHDSFFSRWLHNYTIFAVQRRFYNQGIPVVILPIRL